MNTDNLDSSKKIKNSNKIVLKKPEAEIKNSIQKHTETFKVPNKKKTQFKRPKIVTHRNIQSSKPENIVSKPKKS